MILGELRNEIKKETEKYYDAAKQVRHLMYIQFFRDRYPDLHIEDVDVNGFRITVNDMTLSWKWDGWLNAQFDWSGDPLCLDYLTVFADYVQDVEEHCHHDHCYKYRATQELYASLCKKVGSHLDFLERILVESCKRPVEGDDRRRHGCAAWLLTRSYVCDDAGYLGKLLSSMARKEFLARPAVKRILTEVL